MATIGLKGVWGLEQLDRTGIATWKLGVLLMGGGALIGAMLIPILGGVNSDSVLASLYAPRLVAILLVVVLFGAGFFSFLSLFLVRTTEADLRLLISIDDRVNESVKQLRPTTRILLLSILFALMVDYSIFPVINAMTLDITIAESFSAIHSSGVVLNVIQYPLELVNALALGVVISIFITQSSSLIHAARHMKVDLLQLSRYSAIANPFFRLIVVTVALSCLLPPMILFVDDPTFSVAWAFLALASTLGFIPIFLLYAYPILILKNRISEEKQKELDALFRAMEGDDSALESSRIKRHAGTVSVADLLTHRMFIDSLWDLPIASHVQKLVLFGLLPPITWVLAAAIENALY